MKYLIRWCDVTEYETEVEADSREEAREKFDSGEHSGYEPTGWVQMEENSLSIEEITELTLKAKRLDGGFSA